MSLLHLAPLFPPLPVLCPEPLLPCGQRRGKHTLRLRQQESCSLAEFTPPTGYEPKLLDDFHYSETTEMIFPEESGDKGSVPSYLCDAERRHLSEKRSLHHCSSRSEKNQRTGDKLITLMKKVCCQLSHFSHTQERRDPCTNLVR